MLGNKSCLNISENYNYFEIAAYFVLFLTSFSSLALRIHSLRQKKSWRHCISYRICASVIQSLASGSTTNWSNLLLEAAASSTPYSNPWSPNQMVEDYSLLVVSKGCIKFFTQSSSLFLFLVVETIYLDYFFSNSPHVCKNQWGGGFPLSPQTDCMLSS